MKRSEARKALIVEDNETFRQLLHVLVAERLACAEVLEAGTLRDARSLIWQGEPDVVFLDVRLPDGNGLSFVRELRSLHPNLPVVICSTHNLREYRDAARELGAAGFVPKNDIFRDAEWGKIRRVIS